MTYEALGKHIQLVDIRNTENISDRVLGININKYFMPSVANVIGTDLSKYKLLRKGMFACNPMHVGRDERLPVAVYEEEQPAIVSPAYFTFEIKDADILNAEYLMLWFRRPEFDRICWLKTDGSVRGGITWDDICRLEVPIIPLEEQLHIVWQYQVIADRIALKEKINDNLEATALAIFKETFISGINEEQLPQGWRKAPLDNIADVTAGGDRPSVCVPNPSPGCDIPVYSNGIEDEGLYGYTNFAKIFDESVTISARGTVGFVCLREIPYVPIVRLISVVPKSEKVTAKYLYFVFLLSEKQSTGTSQQQITVPEFKKQDIVVPDLVTMEQFSNKINPLFTTIRQNKEELQLLQLFQTNVLTTLSH